jgi:hypothetical protein
VPSGSLFHAVWSYYKSPVPNAVINADAMFIIAFWIFMGKPDTHHPHHPAVVNRSMAAAAPAAPAHECLRRAALAGTQETTCLARILGYRARPPLNLPFSECGRKPSRSGSKAFNPMRRDRSLSR